MVRLSVLLATLGVAIATPAAALVNVTISAPGSASASVTGYDLYVNDLNSASSGQSSFAFAGSAINATTTGWVGIAGANIYGGAGGTGSYGSLTGDAMFQLSSAVNYFGLWGSALDGNNTVELYNNDLLLGSYSLQSTLQSASNFSNAYYSNPFGGGNGGEMYAFFNFVSDSAFNKVRLLQNGGGGFEFDNLTVGTAVVSAAPEPMTWAMMLIGFGAIGWSLRRARVEAPAIVASRGFA